MGPNGQIQQVQVIGGGGPQQVQMQTAAGQVQVRKEARKFIISFSHYAFFLQVLGGGLLPTMSTAGGIPLQVQQQQQQQTVVVASSGTASAAIATATTVNSTRY